MDDKQYIENRVDDQISWYNRKSGSNKKLFQCLKLLEVILALLIPFLIGFVNETDSLMKLTVGAIGVIIAAIAGIITLYRFQENWFQYRTTAESLKHEKFLFLTKTHPYTEENAFNLFVGRIESLISKENTNWAKYIKGHDKNTNE